MFGVLSVVNDKDAKKCEPCVAGSAAADASNQSTDRALRFSNISNVTLPPGVLGAGLGALLVFTAGPTEKVALVPSIGPRAASIDVVWRSW